MSTSVRCLKPSEINQYISSLAQLRIEIFRDFPYIYEGSESYEVKYLKKYLLSKRAAIIVALNENTIVGAATCLPLSDEDENVQKPFQQMGYDQNKIFYFGESVLQKKYRGQGIGKAFFKERESWVRSFGSDYETAAFCAVERPPNHNLRPPDYQPLDLFWSAQGFVKKPELQAQFSWQDLGETNESSKKMIFWLKSLNESKK